MVKRYSHKLLVGKERKRFARRHIVGTIRRGKKLFRIYCPVKHKKGTRCPVGTRVYEKLTPKEIAKHQHEQMKRIVPRRVYKRSHRVTTRYNPYAIGIGTMDYGFFKPRKKIKIPKL